jgi:GT2 family glycosyltransferase
MNSSHPTAVRPHSDNILIVCATRASQKEFLAETALGRSLEPWYRAPHVELMLFEHNSLPLGTVYNEAIESPLAKGKHLVFVHDDVQLADFDWPEKIIAGLRKWHVLGLAGNRRRVRAQPAWCFVDLRWTWDDLANLSGTVGHGHGGAQNISRYGRAPRRCVLLDGLLLAANSTTLLDHGLRFDPQFAFHFYDLDFCRQAQARGLVMGTWPIQVVHGSGGHFGTEVWRKTYQLYLQKYGELQAPVAS